MKIGDLVKYRLRSAWLGIIVEETPGTMKLKTVEWIRVSGDISRGAHKEKDLELVSEGQRRTGER